jgi:hypothetical protein
MHAISFSSLSFFFPTLDLFCFLPLLLNSVSLSLYVRTALQSEMNAVLSLKFFRRSLSLLPSLQLLPLLLLPAAAALSAFQASAVVRHRAVVVVVSAI